MPSDNPKIKKALKDGKISKKQYDKLPEKLLLGIIAKKGKGKATTTTKGMVKKTGKLAYEKGKGVKEERKKLGSQAHKRGRPKSGSKVEIKK
tara:strand:+ start:156 stop:431 length:276 start_codon:yes stop_codon:yes gene_type:complete